MADALELNRRSEILAGLGDPGTTYGHPNYWAYRCPCGWQGDVEQLRDDAHCPTCGADYIDNRPGVLWR